MVYLQFPGLSLIYHKGTPSLPLALQNGVDVKTVSSILGHFDAGFTLRTYTHVTTKMQEEAAATMGRLIGASV